MRAYLITTGLLFLLLSVAHVARVAMEGPRTLNDPFFLISSLLAVAMTVWAVLLVRRRAA